MTGATNWTGNPVVGTPLLWVVLRQAVEVAREHGAAGDALCARLAKALDRKVDGQPFWAATLGLVTTLEIVLRQCLGHLSEAERQHLEEAALAGYLARQPGSEPGATRDAGAPDPH